MRNGDLIRALLQYPEDWEVESDYCPIEKVEVAEGNTSDGPGCIVLMTVEQ